MTKVDSNRVLEFVVIIKVKRKTKGGKRDGRHGHTGKIGIVCHFVNGKIGEEIFRAFGPTFKDVSRQLHNPGPVPAWVSIDSRGETYF